MDGTGARAKPRRRALGLRLTGAAAAGLLLVAPLRGAAATPSAPEDFGPLSVAVDHVKIPVPIDPHGPEGVLPVVAADIYIPAGPGPFPLIQISHAWPGTLREFPLSGWAERLASRGFVVAVSDRRLGSNLALIPSLDQPVDLLDLSTEVNAEDILRVLRWALAENLRPQSALAGKVDAGRIGIAGHSLGGYFATFAAVKAQTEGPRLSALVLLDPADERLGTHTLTSSLAAAPRVRLPTVVLASEENQHPIMCDMADGTDCTLVANQEYRALTEVGALLGLRVIGSVHEDVEDPKTGSPPNSPAHLQMFERYGMAWLEYWVAGDCAVAGYLGGGDAGADVAAGRIAVFPGGSQAPACATTTTAPAPATVRQALRALPITTAPSAPSAPALGLLLLGIAAGARRRRGSGAPAGLA